MSATAERITSRSNPLVVQLRRLAQDNAAYRRAGEVWLEGEHLCAAALARTRTIRLAVLDEDAAGDTVLRTLAAHAARVVHLPRALFVSILGLESPARIGCVLPLPVPPAIDAHAASVVLDRIQDPGNVGSILRSAAAFGVRQVLALAGTAGLWSPKVLRAAMGAQFALDLVEGLDEAALGALKVPLLGTSPHARASIADAPPPSPAAWVFGHEGQGVAPWLTARCAHTLRIPQPGGQESLNVAAAAAVCLYEATRRSPA